MHDLVFDIAVCTMTAWVLAGGRPGNRSAGDPRLSHRRLRDRSVGLEPRQLAGIDRHHFRARSHLPAFHDRARDRSAEDHRAGRVILVASVAQIAGCCLLGNPALLPDGPAVWRRSLGRPLPRRWSGAQLDRHHRQGAVRQARTRHPAGPGDVGHPGAAGPVRHPVPGHSAEPQRPAAEVLVVLRAARGRARRLGPAHQPLRPAGAVLPHRPTAGGSCSWVRSRGASPTASSPEELHLSREMGALVAGVSPRPSPMRSMSRPR